MRSFSQTDNLQQQPCAASAGELGLSIRVWSLDQPVPGAHGRPHGPYGHGCIFMGPPGEKRSRKPYWRLEEHLDTSVTSVTAWYLSSLIYRPFLSGFCMLDFFCIECPISASQNFRMDQCVCSGNPFQMEIDGSNRCQLHPKT